MAFSVLSQAFRLVFLSPTFLFRMSAFWLPIFIVLYLYVDLNDSSSEDIDLVSVVSFIFLIISIAPMLIITMALNEHIASEPIISNVVVFHKNNNTIKYFVYCLYMFIPLVALGAIMAIAEVGFILYFSAKQQVYLHYINGLLGILIGNLLFFTLGLALPSIAIGKTIGIKNWLPWAFQRLPSLLFLSAICALVFSFLNTTGNYIMTSEAPLWLLVAASIFTSSAMFLEVIFGAAVLSYLYQRLAIDHPPRDHKARDGTPPDDG